MVQQKLQMLFHSLDFISNAKSIEDKYKLNISQQSNRIDDLLEEKSVS